MGLNFSDAAEIADKEYEAIADGTRLLVSRGGGDHATRAALGAPAVRRRNGMHGHGQHFLSGELLWGEGWAGRGE